MLPLIGLLAFAAPVNADGINEYLPSREEKRETASQTQTVTINVHTQRGKNEPHHQNECPKEEQIGAESAEHPQLQQETKNSLANRVVYAIAGFIGGGTICGCTASLVISNNKTTNINNLNK